MICHSDSAWAQTRVDPNVSTSAIEKKYERQLFVALDVKRKDIDQKNFLREAKDKNSKTDGLNSRLGNPEDAERLLYREPTPFEVRLYEAGQSDELHVLHRTVVLTYSSKEERDKQKEKVVKTDGVKSVYAPSDVTLSVSYPNDALRGTSLAIVHF